MKTKFERYPTRTEVKQDYRRLADKLGIEPPQVVWRDSHNNSTHDTHINLSSPQYCQRHDPNDDYALTYWITVYHEFSHWAIRAMGADDIDHRVDMYVLLLGICMAEGMPLDKVIRAEKEYKPGAVSRAARKIGHRILEGAYPY